MKNIVPAVTIALFLAACGKQEEPAPPPPPQVGFVVLQPQAVTLTTELPGRTSAYETSEVRPQVNGIVLARLFEEGDTVRQGQPLYRIDPTPYQAQVASARAALTRARAAIASSRALARRYGELVKINAISRQEFENATTGAHVTAAQTQPLATIQRIDPMFVDIQQSSADLLRLRQQIMAGAVTRGGPQSARVRLKLEDGSTYPVEGTLQFADVTVDPTTGSQAIRARFANPHGLLLPGMFARAEMVEGTQGSALLVPQRGVTRDEKGQATVMVVGQGNKAEPRVVQASRVIGDNWLVTGGVKQGDRVIVEGAQNLQPGAQINPVPYDPNAKPASQGGQPGAQPQGQPQGQAQGQTGGEAK